MKHLSFLLLGAALSLNVVAQDPTYTLELDAAEYVALADPTLISPNQTWDDPDASWVNGGVVELGFTFSFFNQPNTTLTISNLSDMLITGTDIYEPGIDILAGVFSDYIDRGESDGTNQSDISYQRTGAAGNYIGKFQWRNVGFYDDDASNFSNFANVQVWIYEATGNIEVRFGANSNPPLGITGSVGSLLVRDFDYYGESFLLYTGGAPASPTLIETSNINDFYETGMLSGFPQETTIYRFIPGFTIGVTEAASTVFEAKLYPSVTDGLFTLELAKDEPCELVVHDLTGKVVMTELLRNKTNNLDASTLESGIYLVTVSQGAERVTKRLVKK